MAGLKVEKKAEYGDNIRAYSLFLMEMCVRELPLLAGFKPSLELLEETVTEQKLLSKLRELLGICHVSITVDNLLLIEKAPGYSWDIIELGVLTETQVFVEPYVALV